jgi:hypothetical protein
MLAGIIFLAKMISLAVEKGQKNHFSLFLFAPLLSFRSMQQILPVGELSKNLLPKAGLLWFLLASVYFFLVPLTDHLPWWICSYLAVLPFWLLIESIQVAVELLWLLFGYTVPAISNSPLASRSVGEFWGRRWNRLFGDWLYQVCFRPFLRKPCFALFFTFSISALIHELLVSVPLWLTYRKNCFGWMFLYFSLQAAGIAGERKWLRQNPFLKRCFTWVVVLGPVPLILNPGTLLIFHLSLF